MGANPFEDAIDLIRENGWWDGSIPSKPRTECTATAIARAMCGYSGSYEETLCLFLAAADIPPAEHASDVIFAWNDAPGRTEEDVILAMKKAAVAWEERVGAPEGHEEGRSDG